MNAVKLFILLLAAALFVAACDSSVPRPGSATTSNTATPVTDPTIVQLQSNADDNAVTGKELYAMNCMICHKESGKGGKVTIEGKTIEPDDLTKDSLKKATDEKLIGYVTNGIPDEGMPAFVDKLTPEEIKTIISHVRELQK